ncbi:class I SAM-dependent methyltransferase [Spirosoma daeguense]
MKTIDTTGKYILDACCGSKMFWFDKSNPNVLFADIRTEEHVLCDGRNLTIQPDVQVDFRCMPFADNTFKLVVFDPPHLKSLGQNSWTAKKYGVLLPSWETDIRAGFDECMRVLQPYGTLIFKWNETQIKTSKILDVIGATPLLGHQSGKSSNTHWLTFMKGLTTSADQPNR